MTLQPARCHTAYLICHQNNLCVNTKVPTLYNSSHSLLPITLASSDMTYEKLFLQYSLFIFKIAMVMLWQDLSLTVKTPGLCKAIFKDCAICIFEENGPTVMRGILEHSINKQQDLPGTNRAHFKPYTKTYRKGLPSLQVCCFVYKV